MLIFRPRLTSLGNEDAVPDSFAFSAADSVASSPSLSWPTPSVPDNCWKIGTGGIEVTELIDIVILPSKTRAFSRGG